ncbi:MAG: hypothetical protein ED556_08810 [Winogradskyella sp.]|uniref:hypothetical protein n=1 Tax=Winogradskyella sp. TaxID=1883156 RepID=UPI000F3FEB82|nr:hypothetical protein [Winogradskyella sp.]RNC86383.1 MAG: hypothetical protein ED556_08810 [Winogradskyella sp.]
MNNLKTLKGVAVLCIALLTSCNQNKGIKAEEVSVLDNIKIERIRVYNGNKDSTSLSSYIIKEFDSLGTETKSTYYNADDSVMMQFNNEYTNGNKTKINWINKTNKLVRYVTMEYDGNGKIIKSESYKPSGDFIEGYMHKWKDNNKIEEKGPITDSVFKPNSIYTYNQYDEFTSLVEYDENDSLYGTFTWKYIKLNPDKEWTERQMYFNDTLVRIEKRYLTYQ